MSYVCRKHQGLLCLSAISDAIDVDLCAVVFYKAARKSEVYPTVIGVVESTYLEFLHPEEQTTTRYFESFGLPGLRRRTTVPNEVSGHFVIKHDNPRLYDHLLDAEIGPRLKRRMMYASRPGYVLCIDVAEFEDWRVYESIIASTEYQVHYARTIALPLTCTYKPLHYTCDNSNEYVTYTGEIKIVLSRFSTFTPEGQKRADLEAVFERLTGEPLSHTVYERLRNPHLRNKLIAKLSLISDKEGD